MAVRPEPRMQGHGEGEASAVRDERAAHLCDGCVVLGCTDCERKPLRLVDGAFQRGVFYSACPVAEVEGLGEGEVVSYAQVRTP